MRTRSFGVVFSFAVVVGCGSSDEAASPAPSPSTGGSAGTSAGGTTGGDAGSGGGSGGDAAGGAGTTGGTGGAPSAGAGGSSGTSGGGAGGTTTSDVHGKRVRLWLGDGTSEPIDLTSFTFEAIVDQSGVFTTIAGTGAADGTFTIPAVPDGPYLLHMRTSDADEYTRTSSRAPDLSIRALGRKIASASSTTRLELAIGNLAAWANGDRIEIGSRHGGLYDDQAAFQLTPKPTAGATMLDGSIPYGKKPLLDASMNDDFWAIQLEKSTTASGATLRAVTRGAVLSATVQDGATTKIDVPLTEPAQTAVASVWNRKDFETIVRSLHPSITKADAFNLFVDAVPVETKGSPDENPGTPDLFTLDATTAADEPLAFAYGNPFVDPGWKTIAGARAAGTASMAIPGAKPMAVPLDVRVFWEGSTISSGPIEPVLGPPKAPTIEGKDALSANDGVGATPLLAWSAPDLGTATWYELRLAAADAASGTTAMKTGEIFHVFRTTETELRLPAGVLQPGTWYFAALVAHSGTWSDSEPNAQPEPSSGTAGFVGPFRP